MLLRQWIDLSPMSCLDFSKKIGIPQPLLHYYMSGDTLPRIDNIQKIEKFTGGAVSGEDIVLYWLNTQRQKRKEKATAEGRHE
jgi:predicted transcriptional regulator